MLIFFPAEFYGTPWKRASPGVTLYLRVNANAKHFVYRFVSSFWVHSLLFIRNFSAWVIKNSAFVR